MKERAKKNWFVQNWGKIAAVLFFLFAPLKWIRKIWDFVKDVWNFSKDHPLVATILLIGTWILGPLNLLKLGIKSIGKILTGGFKLLKAIPGFLKAIPGFLKKIPGHLGTAVGKMKKWGKNVFGKEGFLQKTVPSKLGTAAGTVKRWGRQGVEGVKSFGGTMKKGVQTIGTGAVKATKAVGGKLGDMASSTKGIFGSLVKKFGSAGKWIMKLGSKLIMPLVTTPVGWAILAGLAIGGLAYVFWDDIKAIWEKSVAFISETFSKLAAFASSMVGGARTMLGNFLRSVGAGMIADWIDPDGADKSKPAKKFTWKNFGLELWNIYTGIWKKVLSLAGAGMKAVRGIAASWARSMGWNKIGDWIEGKEEKEQPTGTDSESQDGKPDEPQGETAKESKAAKAWRQKSKGKNIVEFAKERKSERSFWQGDETTEEIQVAYNEYKKSLTGAGPGTTAPVVSKPPMSDFKVSKGFKPTTTAEAKAQADFPDDPEDVEDTRIAMDLEKRQSGTYQAGKLIPQDSPSDKMNLMNNVNKENQSLQGQSGSTPIIIGGSTTNSSSTTTGDVNTFGIRQAQSNKILVTSMLK
jgi:hypothetical protein